MTSITKILVRDTDQKSDTSIELSPGGELNPAQLPKNWTLEFFFSTKFRQVAFSIDARPVHIEEGIPFCPAGDNNPINLPAGPHSICVTVDAQPAQTVNFTITSTPTATPTAQTTCTFGTNGEGVSNSTGDPQTFPQLLATCKNLGFEYFRLWADGDFKTPFVNSYWKIPQKWAAGNVKVLVVINFQNSPRNTAPADADWLMKINSLPDAKDSGIWGICLGNECDTAAYFNGSVSQLAHLMQLAYPILKSKGYIVIAPSMIHSLDPIKQLVALGASPFCDYLDFHVYESTAIGALAKIDAFETYCASINKPAIVTECGIRGSKTNLVGWSQQITAFFTGLKSRTGIYFQFPLYWLPGSTDPLTQMSPLASDMKSPNQPFATAWNTIIRSSTQPG